jgi:hypothetical protein
MIKPGTLLELAQFDYTVRLHSTQYLAAAAEDKSSCPWSIVGPNEDVQHSYSEEAAWTTMYSQLTGTDGLATT